MPASLRPKSLFLRPELVVSWREIIAVLLILLAPFVVMSAWMASRGSQHRFVQSFLSDRALLINAAGEAAILGLALVYLQWRGWKPADLNIRPGFWSSLQALALIPITVVLHAIFVVALLGCLFAFQTRYHSFAEFILANSPSLKNIQVGQLSWVVLIGAMILNAYLEEIICTAYAFSEFAAKCGPVLALLLIVLLRAACHTYQGPVQALGIGIVFLIFTLGYWRTRNLRTLILAHALVDIGSLSAIKLLAH